MIIPNSDMADGQITNYTLPDPNYRLQLDIGIEYGENLDNVRQVLGDAVRNVDGVLTDQPVQVLFIEFGDSSMTVRVRWWIDTYSDKRAMQDAVNSALQKAIEKSGIISPNPALDLNVKMKGDSKAKG